MISDRRLMHFQRKMAQFRFIKEIQKSWTTEMFKVSKNLAPPKIHEIFRLKVQSQYNLRYNSLFSRPLVKSVYKGTKGLGYIPDTYKNIPDLISFKAALKK